MSLVLNNLGAIFNLLWAFFAIFFPKKAARILSITPYKKQGISEIRSSYGGISLGLSVIALWVQEPLAFQCLAFAYLGPAFVRILSMFWDKSVSKNHFKVFIIEIVVGVMLLV